MPPAGQPVDQVFRPRLLIVEDDVRLCALVQRYLETMGYSVELAHTGEAALKRARAASFHALILDVMLPGGMDGFELLHLIRAESDVPVLMLTGRAEETDRIVGLEMGADDYLPKTTSTRELLARLKALLRRSTMSQHGAEDRRRPPLTIGALTVDPSAYQATLDGRTLDLTRLDFDLLYALARSAGRVRTRESLLLEVGERGGESLDRTIDVRISLLRKKLGDDPKSPRWIETVRGVGYLFLRPQTLE
ncbi:MAG: response regulator transcription factor [Bryobacterales bacterium]|nr:response regulator transcription factor [Bryobacterales bacterium]